METVIVLGATFWFLWSLYRPEWEAKAERRRKNQEIIDNLPRYPKNKS